MAISLRPYQEAAILAAFKYINGGGKAGILALPTGCHAKGQRVIMSNGTLKNVEDVKVGDHLLGPNSEVKTVLCLHRGRQEMRLVTPKRFGDPFVVNKDHILSLYKTKQGGSHPSEQASYVNETVDSWQSSSKWHKHIHKLWKPKHVHFHCNIELPVDPYVVGAMLGDGSLVRSIGITSMDQEVFDYIDSYATRLGDTIRISNNGSKADSHYYVGENLKDKFVSIGLFPVSTFEKFIPNSYLRSSYEDRLQLLAGLIDTDGHVNRSKGHTIEYTTVSDRLCNDILFLVRSLGFTASFNEKTTSWVHNGEKKFSTAFRIHFSGDTSVIPLKIKRHACLTRPPVQRFNNCTAFSVTNLPEDEYYGFEIDGDNLYLTEDYTVHHNSGKSRVIAEMIRRVLAKKNHVRFMMLTHVKELIEQNAARIKEVWPICPLGIYSASIGMKQFSHPVIFGGIQSCFRHPERFGHIDMLLVDEAHMISDKAESMYGVMIEGLKKKNPNLVVLGLTATPYRLGMGHLTEGPIFKDVVFDNTTMDDFIKLIDDGFLCDLIPQQTDVQFDLSNVKMSGGDFQEQSLDDNINRDEITRSIVLETIKKAQGRNKGLAFCISKSHAENMASRFTEAGWPATFVHSDLKKEERQKRLDDYAKGIYKIICNVGVLTTGYDSPETDFLVIARPTQSTSLHVQIMGRGMRPHPSKPNTLVLDFAGNTARLGPVNDPVIPVKKGEAKGDPPIRICTVCGTINHAAARVCKLCGEEFPPPKVKVNTVVDITDIIKRSNIPKIVINDVQSVLFNPYVNHSSNSSMIKMTVYDGSYMNDVYLTFDPAQKGAYNETQRIMTKLKFSTKPPVLSSNKEAIEFLKAYLIKPTKIKVWLNKPILGKNKKVKAILDYIYEG